MRKDVVPVYSISGSVDPIRYVSRTVAVAMVQAETLSGIYRGNGKARELVGLRMKELEKLTSRTPATIKMSEVIANAGGYGKSKTVSIPDSRKDAEGIEPDFVEKALAKIRAWPTASGNCRAVTVVPRAAFA
jgi:hypothetical protein